MLRLNAGLRSLAKKSLKAFVPESLDHDKVYRYKIQSSRGAVHLSHGFGDVDLEKIESTPGHHSRFVQCCCLPRLHPLLAPVVLPVVSRSIGLSH